MNNFFTYIFFSVSLCLFFTLDISSQVVSNILVSQEQNNIVVSYDLLVSTSCSISLQVSQDGGASWSSSLKSVKGDVGEKIVSGSHTITWFVLEEYNELRGDNIKFKVSASSGFPVIKIGSQVWTSKNLDVATYRNGDVIPQVQDQNAWANLRTGAWCYYDNDASNGTKYGKLYNWYAVNDPRGLAPKGFHIPSDAEWTVLTDYLGGTAAAGTKMKSSFGWDSNGNGTNSSGFAGFPGGFRSSSGTFYDVGRGGSWWSATERDSYYAWYRNLFCSYGSVFSYSYYKQDAFSVRCLGDLIGATPINKLDPPGPKVGKKKSGAY
jgi:uncharacterized protein (TIGR02145 family)